ncbi:hypothetical protein WJX74_009752 [Apatococcus lobatus]|uniref:BZIP domain-containing protein n=1 Tax=Apatococcus lobatus TaxID=904363 RepID=A0AAW1RUM9_9CHLO
MLDCLSTVAMQPHFPLEQAAVSLADLERAASREQHMLLATAGSSWGQRSYDANLAALLFPEVTAATSQPPPQASLQQPLTAEQPLTALEHLLQPTGHLARPSSVSRSHCQPIAASCLPPSPFAKMETEQNDSPNGSSGEYSAIQQQQQQHRQQERSSDNNGSQDETGQQQLHMTQQQMDEERAERLRAKNRHAQQRYRERKVKYRDSQKRYRERQKDAKSQQVEEKRAAADTIARLKAENAALTKRSSVLEGALSRAQTKLASAPAARTIIKADSGVDPSLEEGVAISINLRGPCLLTRSHLIQMTLDQHFDLNKALKQKLEGSLTALFCQTDRARCSVSHRQLESSFAEFIFMTRAAGAVQPQRARQLLALNLENQQPAEGDPRPRLLSVLAALNLTHSQKLGIIAARDEYLKVLDLLQIRQQQPLTEWATAAASHLQPLKLIQASSGFNSILKEEYRVWDEMQVSFYTQVLNVRQAAMMVTRTWPIHPDIVLVGNILEEQLARPTCLVSWLSGGTESDPVPSPSQSSQPGLGAMAAALPVATDQLPGSTSQLWSSMFDVDVTGSLDNLHSMPFASLLLPS